MDDVYAFRELLLFRVLLYLDSMDGLSSGLCRNLSMSGCFVTGPEYRLNATLGEEAARARACD